MATENKQEVQPEAETPVQDTQDTTQAPETQEAANPLQTELEAARKALADKEEQYLRLAAEYDNYRKRTPPRRRRPCGPRPRRTPRWPSCRCTTIWSGP